MAESDQPDRGLLQYLILFVTARCNARCGTCFYWKEMENAPAELSVDEIRRISKPIGKLPTLLFSGGEPTLRKDLPEIAEIFFRQNQLEYIGLPSNGLMPERAVELAEEILTRCPALRLDVNVSLDDIGERHDAIRGVQGNFERALETIGALCSLRVRYDRLYVNAETVLFSENWRNIRELLDYVRERLDVNGHYVELLRGNPRDGKLDLPPIKEIHRIHQHVLKNHQVYHDDPRKRRWEHEMPYLRELYRWQEDFLRGGKWPAVCPAGSELVVIEPDGRVRGCEMRGIIGNLRDRDYDLRRILGSSEAEQERCDIRHTQCSCTHCVFIYQTFAVHALPNSWRRRLADRWQSLRGRVGRIFQ